MKQCPFCAEEILDAAKVCKHCGRDLVSTATAQKVEIVQPAPPKAKTGCVTWIAVIFFALLAMGWCTTALRPTPPPAATTTTTPSAPATPPTPPLEASVSFTGAQFVISNLGAEPWARVRLMIDPGVFNDGYALDVDAIAGKRQYSVGALQFADSDGKRFNPLQQKPRRFRIHAHVDGKLRFWNAGLQ